MHLRIIAIVALLALYGCREQETFGEADGKILCDPETGHAYYAQHGTWNTSFVIRTPSADAMCKGSTP